MKAYTGIVSRTLILYELLGKRFINIYQKFTEVFIFYANDFTSKNIYLEKHRK